jgi:hypothetical protein
MMFVNIVLARINVDSILNSSTRAREALNEIWSYLGSSTLYELILTFSRLLLGVAIVFYAYQIYRRILDDLDYRPLIPLIIVPVIFLLLLGNPRKPADSFVWNLSVQLRNTIYWLDRSIMAGLVRDADLSDEIRLLQVDNLTRAEAEADLQRCGSLADPEEQKRCRDERLSVSLASIALERGQAFGNRRTASSNWFDSLLSSLEQGFQGASFIATRGFGDIIVDALGVVIVVMSNIFNYCIEAGFVVTTIVAPFAVGFSLFPLPTKPIYTWLIGYMGLGLWKIGTDVLAGIGAYVMNRTDDFAGFNYIMFSLLVGIFAPVIAGGFSSFSALSISQGFTQGTSQVIQQTVKTVGLVTGLGAFVATRGMGR